MRVVRIPLYVALIFATLAAGCSNAHQALDDRTARIVDAINRDICFSSFWYGAEYNFGTEVSATITEHDKSLDVQSNDVLRSAEPFSTHFKVSNHNGIFFVRSSDSRNLRIIPDHPTGQQAAIKFRTPDHCIPQKSRDTARLRVIERILKDEFSSFNRIDGNTSWKNARVLIANVDDLYYTSLVYVPSTKQVFMVGIVPGMEREPYNPTKYTFGEFYNREHIRDLVPKFERYGIQKTIP